MNRFFALASALALSASLAACASPSETEATAAMETPTLVKVADISTAEMVESGPLPMAIAPARAGSPEDALVTPVSYSCEDGRRFFATFPEHGNSVTIAAAGETRVLAHRGASDTVMFSDGDVTLTAEGADATLTGIDAAYTGCMAG